MVSFSEANHSWASYCGGGACALKHSYVWNVDIYEGSILKIEIDMSYIKVEMSVSERGFMLQQGMG